jgi:protein Tex
MVTVSEVDVPRKRISLTMKDQAKGGGGGGEKRSSGGGDRKQGNSGGGKGQPKKQEPLNPFQAKLAELKKKFND